MIINKENFRNWFAVGIITACFGVLIYIATLPKEQRTEDVGDIKMVCISTITLIVGYYFGSSVGSQKSGDTIRDLVKPSDGTTTMTTKSPTPEGEKNDGNIN